MTCNRLEHTRSAKRGPNSRRWRNILLTSIAGAVLTLSGCGNSGSTTSSSDSNPNAVATLSTVADNLSINPTPACSMTGIGATKLTADAAVTILDAATGTTGSGARDKPYCLVKVKVDTAINIWVAMPTSGWNGRFRSEGGGGYAGSVGVATDSVRQGFVGVQTDTGHVASAGGTFGMLSPGVANVALQTDFAYRSEHLMAVIGKQLVKAFYGQDPVRSYWYGCSTGGRQGLMMAQRFPDDYDAILAGAPAIHWDRFQAAQIWPQVVMRQELAVGSTPGTPMLSAKLTLATQRAVTTCDAADGVTDGVIRDPRTCAYDPTTDTTITTSTCTSTDGTCLTAAEATALKKIWGGARNTLGTLLWPGFSKGAALQAMAGATPFSIATEQPKYWVYFDANWDWTTLTYANYEQFFKDTIAKVGPLMATENPDLSAFRARGGKLIMYHGFADPLIMSEGTTMYWDAVTQTMGAANVPVDFAKLYMVPGMGHCGGGAGPNQFGQGSSGNGSIAFVPADATHDIFRALMAWSEKGTAPQAIVASKFPNDDTTKPVLTTRPLCVYPQVAKYNGSGSTDDATNFTCANP